MSQAADDLDVLVDGIRERSEGAFSAVYQLTASGLASFAYGMLSDRQAAEDAVQQAFLELTSAAPGLRGQGRSLRAWLFRSVRYNCLDELRRRSRRPEDATAEPPDTGVTDDIVMPDPELQRALAALTERQRTIVVLRHVVGLTPEEMARVLGTNRTAIYAAAARAERRLRHLLAAVESSTPASSHQLEDQTDPGGGP